MSTVTVMHGDCLAEMRELPDESVDSIVTDPPYGLGFMGKAWDALPPGEEWARECLRVLKPGGHLLAFGGSRTWHRLAVAVEDAGFEIRDSLAWLYGSGFPKSLDVSKAIDKAAGAEREKVPATGGLHANRVLNDDGWSKIGAASPDMDGPNPVTAAARQWQGWGTALKPAFEPVVVARKPLVGTVAANVLAHGTGALNIDASRIGIDAAERAVIDSRSGASAKHEGHYTVGGHLDRAEGERSTSHVAGRFPANVILDESQAEVLDKQSGIQRDGTAVNRNRDGNDRSSWYGTRNSQTGPDVGYGGEGGASRFFYVAKAPKRERPVVDGVAHPTVKPLALMRYLVRLVTPPSGVVLDPFAGSGTTLEAAALEGFRVIGIEREADYLPLIDARLERVKERAA